MENRYACVDINLKKNIGVSIHELNMYTDAKLQCSNNWKSILNQMVNDKRFEDLVPEIAERYLAAHHGYPPAVQSVKSRIRNLRKKAENRVNVMKQETLNVWEHKTATAEDILNLRKGAKNQEKLLNETLR